MENETYSLTVSKFFQEFEERNKNYQGEKDYNKIYVPEKYNNEIENKINDRKQQIKEKLNDSNISKEVKALIKNKGNQNLIYKQCYEKINEALKIKEILNSYNNYQKEKNKNQMIVRNSYSK